MEEEEEEEKEAAAVAVALTALELGLFYTLVPNCCFRGGGSQVTVQTGIRERTHLHGCCVGSAAAVKPWQLSH